LGGDENRASTGKGMGEGKTLLPPFTNKTKGNKNA